MYIDSINSSTTVNVSIGCITMRVVIRAYYNAVDCLNMNSNV